MDDEGPPTKPGSIPLEPICAMDDYCDEDEPVTITTSIEKLVGVQDKVAGKLHNICDLLEKKYAASG